MCTWRHNQVRRKFSGLCSGVVSEVDEAKVYEPEIFGKKEIGLKLDGQRIVLVDLDGPLTIPQCVWL